MNSPSDNRLLYDLGRSYYSGIASLKKRSKNPVRDFAHAHNHGVAEVRTAFKFAQAVDEIAKIAGSRARQGILNGSNPHLTPRTLLKVSRGAADQVKSAMDRSLRGLHPFAPEPSADLPPGDTPWHYDLVRFQRAAEVMDQIGSQSVAGRGAWSTQELKDLAIHTAAIRVAVSALNLILAPIHKGRPSGQSPTSGSAAMPSGVVNLAQKARTLIEAITGDFLRAAYFRLPPTSVIEQIAQVVQKIATASKKLEDSLPNGVNKVVKPPDVVDATEGPTSNKGTYVMILHADKARVLQIGQLGTFWLPTGYWLYVGSARGGGGVAARTGRHCNADATKRWNVDHLKAISTPVELWWTHSKAKVECVWAMALASLPGYCSPAPGCGANDCKRCPSHLLCTSRPPSCQLFAKRLGLVGSGGYSICRERLT